MKGGRFMKMKPRIAKIISLIFILILSLNMVACGGKSSIGNILSDTTPPPSSETPNQSYGGNETIPLGAVDGAPQDGWGTWVYHNYRYEGFFKNGLPNGEGVLSSQHGHTVKEISGNWVDGYADGEIIYKSTPTSTMTPRTFVFTVENGRVPSAINVFSLEENGMIELTPENYLIGVPPWAEVDTDPTLEPPGKRDELFTLTAAVRREREIALRLNVPNLESYRSLEVASGIIIKFGDNLWVSIKPFEEYFPNTFNMGQNDGLLQGYGHYIRGKIQGDDIIVNLYIHEEAKPFDWNSITDFTLVFPQSYNLGSHTLSATEVIKQWEQVINMPTDLDKLSFDISSITVSATDNGDGMVTFTYNDSSINPAYIVPLNWYEGDRSNLKRLFIEYVLWISGETSNMERATRVPCVWFSRVVNGFQSSLNDMTIIIEDEIWEKYYEPHTSDRIPPKDLELKVDENGLTMTWVENLNSGYNFNDIDYYVVTIFLKLKFEDDDKYSYSETFRILAD